MHSGSSFSPPCPSVLCCPASFSGFPRPGRCAEFPPWALQICSLPWFTLLCGLEADYISKMPCPLASRRILPVGSKGNQREGNEGGRLFLSSLSAPSTKGPSISCLLEPQLLSLDSSNHTPFLPFRPRGAKGSPMPSPEEMHHPLLDSLNTLGIPPIPS